MIAKNVLMRPGPRAPTCPSLATPLRFLANSNFQLNSLTKFFETLQKRALKLKKSDTL